MIGAHFDLCFQKGALLKKAQLLLRFYRELHSKKTIQDVIAGIMMMQKKIAKRGVKITFQKMNKLKSSGRK